MAKSRFVTFILSMVPGLGHFYLGLMNRGMLMMGGFFGLLLFLILILTTFRMPFFFVLLPIVWIYSLFDALNLCQRMRTGEKVEDRPLEDWSEFLATGKKSRLWALLFSFIPGAGHMYLGWQQRGLQFMLGFFLSLFLMDWFHLSLFLFLIPVIWFYSMFDTMHLVSGAVEQVPVTERGFISWVAEKQRWVGLGLIFMGMLLLFDQLLVPYISEEVIRLAKTGIVSAIFIGGGLRLIMGKKIVNDEYPPGEN
ncbi:MAG: hypothetical protein ACYCX4_09670 [Bacillota bacterium]